VCALFIFTRGSSISSRSMGRHNVLGRMRQNPFGSGHKKAKDQVPKETKGSLLAVLQWRLQTHGTKQWAYVLCRATTTSIEGYKDKAELEALQHDYEEFKQPDINGDDRISRAELNMYVKNYLSNYPGLQEKDYPKFEDFDHDGDGYVSFQEWRK
jgi:EF hand